jgi:hypothetical protein
MNIVRNDLSISCILLISLLSHISAAHSAPVDDCPEGWISTLSEDCYLLTDTVGSWESNRQFCNSLNSSMLSIRKVEEREFLQHLPVSAMNDNKNAEVGYWLDCFDDSKSYQLKPDITKNKDFWREYVLSMCRAGNQGVAHDFPFVHWVYNKTMEDGSKQVGWYIEITRQGEKKYMCQKSMTTRTHDESEDTFQFPSTTEESIMTETDSGRNDIDPFSYTNDIESTIRDCFHQMAESFLTALKQVIQNI